VATKRKKKGDMDLLAYLYLLRELDPRGKFARAFFKAVFDKFGPEFLVSALTPEQRQEWIRELHRMKAAEGPTDTPPNH
jgi:hypothetical protein